MFQCEMSLSILDWAILGCSTHNVKCPKCRLLLQIVDTFSAQFLKGIWNLVEIQNIDQPDTFEPVFWSLLYINLLMGGWSLKFYKMPDILSSFRIVLSSFLKVCPVLEWPCPVFKWHLKTNPFDNQMGFNHSKNRRVWHSDPHWTVGLRKPDHLTTALL